MRQSIVSVLNATRTVIAGILISVTMVQEAPAKSGAGAYLAGRHALFNSDFDQAPAVR